MRRALDELVQILLAVFGWLAFVWLWCNALIAGPSSSQRMGLTIVMIIDAVTIVMTMLWIRWNVALTRRKGPRRSSRAVEYAYDRDSSGVPVRHEISSSDRFIVLEAHGEGSAHSKVARPAVVPCMESV